MVKFRNYIISYLRCTENVNETVAKCAWLAGRSLDAGLLLSDPLVELPSIRIVS